MLLKFKAKPGGNSLHALGGWDQQRPWCLLWHEAVLYYLYSVQSSPQPGVNNSIFQGLIFRATVQPKKSLPASNISQSRADWVGALQDTHVLTPGVAMSRSVWIYTDSQVSWCRTESGNSIAGTL